MKNTNLKYAHQFIGNWLRKLYVGWRRKKHLELCHNTLYWCEASHSKATFDVKKKEARSTRKTTSRGRQMNETTTNSSGNLRITINPNNLNNICSNILCVAVNWPNNNWLSVEQYKQMFDMFIHPESHNDRYVVIAICKMNNARLAFICSLTLLDSKPQKCVSYRTSGGHNEFPLFLKYSK